MIHHHCCLRYYFWLAFSFVLGNQKHNIVSLDVYLTSSQYCFLFTFVSFVGPTNMAPIKKSRASKTMGQEQWDARSGIILRSVAVTILRDFNTWNNGTSTNLPRHPFSKNNYFFSTETE